MSADDDYSKRLKKLDDIIKKYPKVEHLIQLAKEEYVPQNQHFRAILAHRCVSVWYYQHFLMPKANIMPNKAITEICGRMSKLSSSAQVLCQQKLGSRCCQYLIPIMNEMLKQIMSIHRANDKVQTVGEAFGLIYIAAVRLFRHEYQAVYDICYQVESVIRSKFKEKANEYGVLGWAMYVKAFATKAMGKTEEIQVLLDQAITAFEQAKDIGEEGKGAIISRMKTEMKI